MQLADAAAWIRDADGLLISAGAGMGIDSGLPDFRGPGGFWAVYPALGRARLAFEEIANPAAFAADPRLAWGFYGHRLALYRNTTPHAGYAVLLAMAAKLPHGAFVLTSNVDGQFQKAGFATERVCEIHGSIHHLQCTVPCTERLWPADALQPQIDAENCQLLGKLPHCPHCGELARPNILLFDDRQWLARRSELQQQRLRHWLAGIEHLVTIEIGAGTQIPTIRHFSERVGGRLIRINPGEAAVPERETCAALPLGALAGIARLAAALA
jgi:NAD-dependent SIR2 family protein deacetylase